jgi:hypothetical protein
VFQDITVAPQSCTPHERCTRLPTRNATFANADKKEMSAWRKRFGYWPNLRGRRAYDCPLSEARLAEYVARIRFCPDAASLVASSCF